MFSSRTHTTILGLSFAFVLFLTLILLCPPALSQACLSHSSSSSLLSFSAHLPHLGLVFLFLALILLCSPASSLRLVFRSLPLPRSYPSLLTCLISWACLSLSSSSSLSSFSACLPRLGLILGLSSSSSLLSFSAHLPRLSGLSFTLFLFLALILLCLPA
jgi:hypothetical protein